MMASRSDVWIDPLDQTHIDYLRHAGVTVPAMINPTPVMMATGAGAHDGLFDHHPDGEPWLAFEEHEDCVFWNPRHGRFATYANRVFALGQAVIDEAATYSFDCALNVFDNPLGWLLAKRDGIVVLDWTRAFDRLRDAPRIALAESLLPLYRRHMKPARTPELFIVSGKRRAA
ncbi:hypothetical protein [Aminobacter aminovorans]|uniref:Uncharacterized protein n=1 Tax=Aminobacter aminovorans TaxID=83263 RepID=A0AAC8YQI4_AMIAI|nr:hypothetical protein [Aminobacter aminovorans]AMS42473.1 hypothetical protein AA2016_3551 [Aminobacter aminovorans]MBB3707804.1 hypothetical protein [Aminobacter aminovorans]